MFCERLVFTIWCFIFFVHDDSFVSSWNYSEFYYIQMEKYARQAVSEGVNSAEDLHIGGDSEIYRVLNLHYNRNNHIEVSIDKKNYIWSTRCGATNLYIYADWHTICPVTNFRYLIDSAKLLSKRYANFSDPFKMARTPSNHGKSPFTRWFHEWTIPFPNISNHRTFWSSLNNWLAHTTNVNTMIIIEHYSTRQTRNNQLLNEFNQNLRQTLNECMITNQVLKSKPRKRIKHTHTQTTNKCDNNQFFFEYAPNVDVNWTKKNNK